jgi:hypothetical protein
MESLPYRVAGTLLLLYAQPLMKIVALPTAAIVIAPLETRISLGAEPVSVPEPFADMLKHHLDNRPNLRTAGGMAANLWLFPGHRAGKHLDPHTMMMRLRTLGINLLGARNSALQNLVAEIPPPVVAHLLGYSHNCTPATCTTDGSTMVALRHVVAMSCRMRFSMSYPRLTGAEPLAGPPER